MISFVLLLSMILLGAVAYRIRGGGWLTISSDMLCRLIWGFFGLSIPFYAVMIIQDAPFDIARITYATALIPLAYCAMFVVHAFAQNMGTFGRPWTLAADGTKEPLSKYWPALWLTYPLTQAEWNSCPMLVRTVLDFFGMLSSAFFQGAVVFGIPWLIVFILPKYFSIHLGVEDMGFARAWAVITAGCPVGYLMGRFTPQIDPSLAPVAPWGEFYTGGVWVLAMAQL